MDAIADFIARVLVEKQIPEDVIEDNARFEIFRNSDHFGLVEGPEKFHRAIRQFVLSGKTLERSTSCPPIQMNEESNATRAV